MTIADRSRVPAGVSTGGQFATQAKAEPAVHLAEHPSCELCTEVATVAHQAVTARGPVGQPRLSCDAHANAPTYRSFGGGWYERTATVPSAPTLNADHDEYMARQQDAAYDEYMARQQDAAYDGYMADVYDVRPSGASDLSQEPPVAAPEVAVLIDDSDDPFGTPLFEGLAGDAGRTLAPGTYRATSLRDPAKRWLVVVPEVAVDAAPPAAQVIWEDRATSGHRHVLVGRVGDTTFEATCEVSEDPDDPYTMRVLVDGTEVGATHRLPSPSTRWHVFSTSGPDIAPSTEATRDEAIARIVAARPGD